MIPLLTAEESRRVDRDAMERLGVPGIVLMENAAGGAWSEIQERYPSKLSSPMIVCGVGQNGGDGFALARLMMSSGHQPCCLLVGARADVRGDAKINLEAVEALGIDVLEISDTQRLSILDGASLIVDALFGTGLSREVEGLYAEVIRRMNGTNAARVALDLPSGVCSDTGRVMGVATQAEFTVTFGARKRGLFQLPGAECAGRVTCVSIGVPRPQHSAVSLLTEAWVGEHIKPRPKGAHKGTAGHVLVVGGSPGKAGAPTLAGLGAMRAGAGLVTVASRAESSREEDFAELMHEALPDEAGAAIEYVLARAGQMQAVVLGPGLGLDPGGRAIAAALMESLPCPTVVDADALTTLAAGAGLASLQSARGPRIMTPHPGEAGRLLHRTSGEVQGARLEMARELATRSGQVAVLKGAYSIISESEHMSICDRGTTALAVAGTGDVLAGTIAALCVSMCPYDAARVGVYLHALSGERQSQGDRGLIAREVAAGYSGLIASLLSGD